MQFLYRYWLSQFPESTTFVATNSDINLLKYCNHPAAWRTNKTYTNNSHVWLSEWGVIESYQRDSGLETLWLISTNIYKRGRSRISKNNKMINHLHFLKWILIFNTLDNNYMCGLYIFYFIFYFYRSMTTPQFGAIITPVTKFFLTLNNNHKV